MTVLSTYFVLLLLRAFLFLFSKRQTPRGACREPLFSLSDSPYVFVLPSRGRSSERNGLYLMLTAFSGPGIIAHSQRFGRKPGQELVCEHRFHTLSAHEHISKTSSKPNNKSTNIHNIRVYVALQSLYNSLTHCLHKNP